MDNQESKVQKVYKVIMLVVLTSFITFMLTSILIYKHFGGEISTIGKEIKIINKDNDVDINTKLSKFKSLIDKYYLGEVDDKKLEEGAIKGYIEALDDKYSEYISKEDMEDYTADIMGNFVGIGIYMVQNTEKDRIEVLAPIKDTPAEKAGLLPGDLIIKVNGEEYKAEDMTVASNKIKGEEGSKVNLEILRGTETLQFEITRSTINTNPVTCEVLESNIGYISLTSFGENTANDFKTKFEELQGKNIKSLIIDLRNNGGGLVEEATNIIDYIADKGSIELITVDKKNNEEVTKSTNNPIISMPIVILVNENTASASEIVAGALKDLGKAKIVGTTTYGKGVIQEFLTLDDGSGLKITTEEYFTPNRTKINKVGIEPDEKVELPETEKKKLVVERAQDTQLQKAIELLK